MRFVGQPRFGCYLHIPFCRSKCDYCDFFSVPYSANHFDRYLRAIRSEQQFWFEPLSKGLESSCDSSGSPSYPATLYLGGGTPNCLNLSDWEQILGEQSVLRNHPAARLLWDSPTSEVTCECNPSGLSTDYLKHLRNWGVNRISIGVQSFHPDELRLLGRDQLLSSVDQAIESILAVGFDSWSLDLIYGLPGQQLVDWLASLEQALAWKPPHLSFYSLTVREGSQIAATKPDFPDPREQDLQAEMFLDAVDILRQYDYEVYELSNAALPGHRCQHNQIYWQGGEWLGLGPAANGYLARTHYPNPADLESYCSAWSKGVPAVWPFEPQVVSQEQWQEEVVMMSLRHCEGLSVDLLLKWAQQRGDAMQALIDSLKHSGYAHAHSSHLCLTPTGWLIHNEICNRLLALMGLR